MRSWVRTLRARGVIGMNERNAEFIQRYNPRRLYPLVDDKLRTKRLALEAAIAVPELYGVVENQHDVASWLPIAERHTDFVIKPAHGTGGDGIMVVAARTSRRQGLFQLVDGTVVSEADMCHHVSNIISGQYSFVGSRDSAMIEYRVESHPCFDAIAFQGVPDVRVLVYKGYPVMAMVRLPTRQSRGKANLHQGAVGAGIDMASGCTLSGVLGNDIVSEHPDTEAPIAGLTIPSWTHFLSLAARCYELTGLGYLGVDIVLDRTKGPLILELNARPGLNIQLANKVGLQSRFDRVDAWTQRCAAEEKVAIVREAFSHC